MLRNDLGNHRVGGHRSGQNLDRQAGISAQLFDRMNNLLDAFLAKIDGGKHFIFGHFPGKPLDHCDGMLGAGNNEIKIAFLKLLVGRHDDELAIDPPDPHARGGLQKRQMRQMQGSAGSDQAQDIRIVFAVRRQGAEQYLHLVEIVGGKQGADGPVDQPGGERLLQAGTGFALDVTARELASGVGFLAVIHREGEKIATGIDLTFHRSGQNHGFAH